MNESTMSVFDPIQPSPAMPPAKKRPHPHRKKVLIFLAVIVTLLLCGAALVWFAQKTEAPARTENQEQTVQVPDSTRVRIIATGDVIGHDALNAAAKSGQTYDYLQFMQNMQPYFEVAQVRFCNQATLAGGTQFGVSGYPNFNAPTELTRGMAKVGCNLINTGSNHANDKTQAALNASVAAWDSQPGILAVAGANRSEVERQAVRYFELEGIKFAFLSYTTYLNSPNKEPYSVTMYSEPLAKKQIAEARKKADVVLVSMRWGSEYSPSINTAQDKQSQFLADQGADIVLGHGPHVLEPVKKLKGKNGDMFVWYSLGNFLNAQVEIEALVSGLAVMDIDIATKKVADIGFLPIYMHYEWTAQEKARQDLLARRNFAMYLLEEAAEPLARSQNNTTVEAQQKRLAKLLNTYTKVPILSREQYLSN